MNPINSNIIVKFDPLPTVGGIIAPERYKIQEADTDGETDAYGVTTNRKAINPQVITVLSGLHKGKKAFVYYGAYEIAKWPEGVDGIAIIPEATILFYVDPIQPVLGTYLGDEVFSEGEKTASGIYTTPFAEHKEGILIKITHIPKEGGVMYGDQLIEVGDTVVTIDQWQYDLRYLDKKYIKLKSTEIVGVKKDDRYIPIGDRVLVEYLPDAELQERIAENDRRSGLRDFMNKNGLHYTATDLEPVSEPKIVSAKVLDIGNDININNNSWSISLVSDIMVFRNYGCLLPNKQWITSIENVIGVLV
jgi:co-chaperonin GroES (HSP10)